MKTATAGEDGVGLADGHNAGDYQHSYAHTDLHSHPLVKEASCPPLFTDDLLSQEGHTLVSWRLWASLRHVGEPRLLHKVLAWMLTRRINPTE